MLRTLFRFRHNLRCTPYCGNPRNSWTGGAGTKVNAVIGPPGRPAQVRGVTQSYRRPTGDRHLLELVVRANEPDPLAVWEKNGHR